ncbi:AarF/UbiB family protein [Roseomonas gilardii]|uniref:AarF/UbiB family protein n=1 Tax=Roseomonas gilardii TaxID=257708 RepID=A0ABU3MD21_9PROT|nr:AarF/UbiB family protein [Roseomonas gilardii]MDT8330314.1 AarF/UbiB family protein [Roseomonas gilardii]
MLQTALVAARDRRRLQQIGAVLVRFGLDDFVQRSGLRGLLRQLGLRQEPPDAEARLLSLPARVRRALEELGPTFIKLGQVLASRADLLPPDWIEELERLHSHVPALPFEALRPQVEEDLGAPPEEVFARFEPLPLASASIAQVHRATLRDGREVVVKIRRPGLRPLVEADLRLLSHLIGMLEAEWPDLARYRAREILRQLLGAMREELDLANEGRNAEAIAAGFADRPEIVFPGIHWEYTTERLLVEDHLEGQHPRDRATLEATGMNTAILAHRGAEAFFRMTLVDGLFHADPHPGNVLCQSGNRIALLDFGTIGRLSLRRRDQVLTLIAALARGKSAGVSDVLLDWAGQPEVDPVAVAEAADAFVARHSTGPLLLSQAIPDFMGLMRDHGLALPADLAQGFKALVTAEGVVRRMEPGFDLVGSMRPMVEQVMRQRYTPRALRNRTETALLEMQGLAQDMPGILRTVLRRMQYGRFSARLEVVQLEKLGRRIEHAALQVAVAVVTGAFAIGLAPLLGQHGPYWLGVPLFVLLGIGATIGGIVWLVILSRQRN